MPAYKFTYFNVKALGESVRMLFHYGGVEFVDERIDFENWPQLKPYTPFGQLPMLEVDGNKVVQSTAIARYLGKKFGLAGKDDWEALQIDATVDTIHDLRAKIAAHSYEKNVESKAEKLKVAEEMVPFYVNKLDEQVKKNGGYFVGGKLTWAEFVFVGLLDYLNHMQSGDIIAKAENLKTLRDKVLAIPSIKTYVAKRPKTDF